MRPVEFSCFCPTHLSFQRLQDPDATKRLFVGWLNNSPAHKCDDGWRAWLGREPIAAWTQSQWLPEGLQEICHLVTVSRIDGEIFVQIC
jgi:hypothetical protein